MRKLSIVLLGLILLMGVKKYENGFRPTEHWDTIDAPRRWRKPRMIFVNSMSDLFHPKFSPEFVEAVFKTMRECPQHIFQVLTKRPMEIAGIGGAFLSLQLYKEGNWPQNVWLGTSIEDHYQIRRAGIIAIVPAPVRFLSCEPLLGPLPTDDLRKMLSKSIHWVIVGGESGPGARPMNADWVREIRDCCQEAAVPFFFKQWGGVQKHRRGCTLDGRTWTELPFAPPAD